MGGCVLVLHNWETTTSEESVFFLHYYVLEKKGSADLSDMNFVDTLMTVQSVTVNFFFFVFFFLFFCFFCFDSILVVNKLGFFLVAVEYLGLLRLMHV